MHDRGAGCDGIADAADSRQRLEIGHHLLRGVEGQVRVLGDDEGEGLACVVELFAVEDGPGIVMHVGGGAVAKAGGHLGKVGGGPDGEDPGHRARGGRVDGIDVGVGHGRAAESEVDQSLELDVSGEAAPPGDQALILNSAHRPADVGRHAPTISRLACPTAVGGG